MTGFKSPLARVRSLIAEDRALALLIPEAQRMQDLNRRFARAVTPAVARACKVMALQGETALVHCANGAAATRLRSQAVSVAKALATAQIPVDALKIRLRADWNRSAKPPKPGIRRAGLDAWLDLDASLPAGELKSAVDRLLAHHAQDADA